MKVAIASPPFPKSIDDGLYWIEKLVKDAAEQQAEIVCFPESYIPGYRLEVGEHSPEKLKAALHEVCTIAKEYAIAVILPMDWDHPEGILNVAYVISNKGKIMGYQTKNQLDPSEDNMFIPGNKRTLFEVNDVKFGIVICHEGFRYPEATRWAARRDAKIVFHPHCTGNDTIGRQITEWGHKDNPYYEKAMIMRAMENTIYFASSNYTMQYPESGSAIIAPDGKCLANQAYGKAGVIVADIDLDKATGLLAKRFKPEFYI
ncbi:Predicted amidohydrolase [Mucilaginibacter mallensis]|uniref:Predicted amidohydrolase n=1 Tax=Mucilaginibacter mallensis TaxID=652787 RepID=A0A1H2AGY9_MUCMA|nr:carbon-nitrogen hydrolase family protein [Mucilaginibacter mallensis]SDT45127.1 Predicted amidohydrolase [Mucilaginibacter mallensis]